MGHLHQLAAFQHLAHLVRLVHKHRGLIQPRAGLDQQVLAGQQTTWVRSAQVT